MNFEGIWGHYPINRPLNDFEKRNRLELKPRGERVEDTSQATVIRLNSVFMETVDKFYPYRGLLVMFAGPALLLFLFLSISFATSAIFKYPEMFVGQELLVKQLSLGLAALLIPVPTLLFCLWTLSKDLFAYTHYPIRLNRRNRMVYVFRSNKPGGVLKVRWDEVYWVLAICDKTRPWAGKYDHEIRGHVMDPDGVTVRDTFCLGAFHYDTGLVRQHWEHFRRYMEGGPGQIPSQELLPIAGRREGFWHGMRIAGVIFSRPWPVWVLSAPLWATMGFFRWWCTLTSRVPRWPADVESDCQVPPGDEPRKKDRVSIVGDVLTWVYLVPTVAFGLGVGAYAYYWLFTASGVAGGMAELFAMLTTS